MAYRDFCEMPDDVLLAFSAALDKVARDAEAKESRKPRRPRAVKLSEAVYPGITKLEKHGALLIPKQISWRRAKRISDAGFGTINPFHERWVGRIQLTDAGRLALRDAGK